MLQYQIKLRVVKILLCLYKKSTSKLLSLAEWELEKISPKVKNLIYFIIINIYHLTCKHLNIIINI